MFFLKQTKRQRRLNTRFQLIIIALVFTIIMTMIIYRYGRFDGRRTNFLYFTNLAFGLYYHEMPSSENSFDLIFKHFFAFHSYLERV